MQSFLLNAKALTICGANFPPSTIVENNQIVRGYAVDIIEEAFKRLEWQYQINNLPWSRCVLMVKSGGLDAVIDTSVYNSPIITGQHPISYNQLAMYVRYDFVENDYSASSLKGQLIGLPRGYTSYLQLAEQHGWTVHEADNEENMFIMLDKGRFNYVLSDTLTAQKMALKVGAKVRHLNPIVASQNYYLGFSPDNRGLVSEFDEVLSEMIQDGTLNRIYLRYLPYTYQEMQKTHLLLERAK